MINTTMQAPVNRLLVTPADSATPVRTRVYFYDNGVKYQAVFVGCLSRSEVERQSLALHKRHIRRSSIISTEIFHIGKAR